MPTSARAALVVLLYRAKYGEALTQAALAARLGLTDRTVRRAVRAPRPLPTFDAHTWRPLPWDVLPEPLPLAAKQVLGILRMGRERASERDLAHVLAWHRGRVTRALAALVRTGWLYLRQVSGGLERLPFRASGAAERTGQGQQPDRTGPAEADRTGPDTLLRPCCTPTHPAPAPPAPGVGGLEEALHAAGIAGASLQERHRLADLLRAVDGLPADVAALVDWARARSDRSPLGFAAHALRSATAQGLRELLAVARSEREIRDGEELRRVREAREAQERRRREAELVPVDPAHAQALLAALRARWDESARRWAASDAANPRQVAEATRRADVLAAMRARVQR